MIIVNDFTTKRITRKRKVKNPLGIAQLDFDLFSEEEAPTTKNN